MPDPDLSDSERLVQQARETAANPQVHDASDGSHPNRQPPPEPVGTDEDGESYVGESLASRVAGLSLDASDSGAVSVQPAVWSESRHRIVRIVVVVVVMLSVVAIAAGVVWAANSLGGRPDHFVAGPGTVADVRWSSSSEGGGYWRTTIEFAHGGGIYSFDSTFGAADTRRGDIVAVYYDPANPDSSGETDQDRDNADSYPYALIMVGLVAGSFATLWYKGSPRRSS